MLPVSGDEHWEPLTPLEVSGHLHGLPSPWWLCGGWALELFAGRPVRRHGDIDVEIPRGSVGELRGLLAGWDLQIARDGRLTRWDGNRPVQPPANSLWCRRHATGPWQLQVMLATVRADRWYFRRDERISRPLSEILIEGPAGLPLLAPEIQLLYKSRNPRPHDQIDFDAVTGLLTPEQRRWLAEGIDITASSPEWRDRLSRSPAPG